MYLLFICAFRIRGYVCVHVWVGQVGCSRQTIVDCTPSSASSFSSAPSIWTYTLILVVELQSELSEKRKMYHAWRSSNKGSGLSKGAKILLLRLSRTLPSYPTQILVCANFSYAHVHALTRTRLWVIIPSVKRSWYYNIGNDDSIMLFAMFRAEAHL